MQKLLALCSVCLLANVCIVIRCRVIYLPNDRGELESQVLELYMKWFMNSQRSEWRIGILKSVEVQRIEKVHGKGALLKTVWKVIQ